MIKVYHVLTVGLDDYIGITRLNIDLSIGFLEKYDEYELEEMIRENILEQFQDNFNSVFLLGKDYKLDVDAMNITEKEILGEE